MGTLGQRVAILRLRKGWSQEELAREIGASQPFISLLEKDRHDPRGSVVARLAIALDVSTDDLLRAESVETQEDATQAVA